MNTFEFLSGLMLATALVVVASAAVMGVTYAGASALLFFI